MCVLFAGILRKTREMKLPPIDGPETIDLMNEWTIGDLVTARLLCTPIAIGDATAMAKVLSDPELYRFTGGEPQSTDELAISYRIEIAGSATPGLQWFNWIIRLRDSHEPIGYLQSTVTDGAASVAWVVGTPWQGHGYASEAAVAMCQWLQAQDAHPITASLFLRHHASARVAQACGLEPTGEFDDDGEQLWQYPWTTDRSS
jgi:RimJ/RimL family protein N-acetyltransferase